MYIVLKFMIWRLSCFYLLCWLHCYLFMSVCLCVCLSVCLHGLVIRHVLPGVLQTDRAVQILLETEAENDNYLADCLRYVLSVDMCLSPPLSFYLLLSSALSASHLLASLIRSHPFFNLASFFNVGEVLVAKVSSLLAEVTLQNI